MANKKYTREGDLLHVEITGPGVADWLDAETVESEIYDMIDPGEFDRLDGWRVDPLRAAALKVTLSLDIFPEQGKSQADLDRRENGVPLV